MTEFPFSVPSSIRWYLRKRFTKNNLTAPQKTHRMFNGSKQHIWLVKTFKISITEERKNATKKLRSSFY